MKKYPKKSKAARFLAQGRPINDDSITYMLRSCNPDMTAHGGFVWPTSGAVSCDDWSPAEECGNGLHGLLMGEGSAHLTHHNSPALWLVVAVWADDVLDLGGKVKVPRGWVGLCGSRADAVATMQSLGGHLCIFGTATAGDCGTATAGDCGTATAGDYGTATAGDCGTATAGSYSTATAGYGGMASAGDLGEIRLCWHDGLRRRTTVGYVGEDGILPNAPYVVVRDGKLVPKS